MHEDSRIQELKKNYVEYFADVPVQKYAAMAIGRDEDTIIRWRKDDSEFADAIQRAKAEWIRKRVLASKAEFALERLEAEVFSPKLSVSVSPEITSMRANLSSALENIGRHDPTTGQLVQLI